MHSYAKITLYEELLQSDVCEEPYLDARLKRYFPSLLSERFEAFMTRHPLRREIIATYFTNAMINATGLTMLQRFQEQFNYSAPEVAQAYIAAAEIFDTFSYRRAIEALDNKVPAELQIDMTIEAGRLIERATLWFLQNQKLPINIAAMVRRYQQGVASIVSEVLQVVTPDNRQSIEESTKQYEEAGVDGALATRCASMRTVYSALDIVEVASTSKSDVLDTARLYFQVGHRLELFWLREKLSTLSGDYWQRIAAEGLYSDLYRYQRLITSEVITNPQASINDMLEEWQREHEVILARANRMVAEIKDTPRLNLAMFTVALREIENLVFSPA